MDWEMDPFLGLQKGVSIQGWGKGNVSAHVTEDAWTGHYPDLTATCAGRPSWTMILLVAGERPIDVSYG